jgi:hypothetical protein
LFSSPEDGKAMTQSNDTTVRNLIADLFRSDKQTGGQPGLAPDQVEVARDYLEQLLLDVTDRLLQHVAGLEQLYQARFVAPLPRSWRHGAAPPVQSPPAGFRHSAVLEEPLALAVLEGGVGQLPASDLARLLLNPCALWDLSDLISTVLPDYWLDRMNERGVQLARDSGIDLDADFEAVVGSAVPPDAKSERAPAGRGEKVGPAERKAGSQTTHGAAGRPFTLWFDEVCSQPARVVLERVQQAEKKPLGDLRIYDLLRDGDRPLLWGVYFFYSREGSCLYVGKNSSRKFVERIPVHLCLYPKDWMNHLVQRIRDYEELNSLIDAAEAARTHTLLLVPVSQKEQTKHLAALEKFFRLFAEPKYNALPRRKRHNRIDLGAPLSEVLEHLRPR